MQTITLFKNTTDNWCPNYHENLVQVTFHGNIQPYIKDDPCYRVSVWGADDMGMEYDTKNENEAYTLFMQVIGLENVNIVDLTELGFVSA